MESDPAEDVEEPGLGISNVEAALGSLAIDPIEGLQDSPVLRMGEFVASRITRSGIDRPPNECCLFVALSSECCIMQHTLRGGSQISAKNRITVNLEDDEYQALQQMAIRADRSLAWLGRRAIRNLLQRESVQMTFDFADEDTTGERRAPR